MFTRRAKSIRIIGVPDYRRPDKWSSVVIEWLRSIGGMITDKGKQTYAEETAVKSQRLNATVMAQPKDTANGRVRVIHNGEYCDLYGSPSVIRTVKCKKTRWAG